jgi:hypothetical protein
MIIGHHTRQSINAPVSKSQQNTLNPTRASYQRTQKKQDKKGTPHLAFHELFSSMVCNNAIVS